ncbi:Ubiquinone biosynthesis O-methyltransferase [compost metagenome]
MDSELAKHDREIIDNDVYNELGERWYKAQDDPIALLRAQTKLEAPWILNEIRRHIGYRAHILDVGCGGGFLANAMAEGGHDVTGIDLSTSSLKVAELYDKTHTVKYLQGDAYQLPFPKECFDVVCAMDLLEHVSDPQKILAEASRVLHPGGLFFFHTFNKNPISYFMVIKGMETFVKNTPKDMHVYSLFRDPVQLEDWMEDEGLEVVTMRGIRPVIFQKAFFKMLWTREVPDNFQFTWTKNPMVSYTGYAKKMREQ